MASVHRTERRNAFCGSRPFWSLAYGNFRVGQLADVLRLYPKTESVGTGQSCQLPRGNRHFSGNFFGIMLLIPFKTVFFARATGCLMLLFFVSMAINLGIMAPLDYSVLTNAAAAFGLAEILKKKENLY